MTLRKHITNSFIALAVVVGAVAVVPIGAVEASPSGPVFGEISTVGPNPMTSKAVIALAWLDHYSATRNPKSFQAFNAERDALAATVATSLLIEPARMQAAWAAADVDHQVALIAGLSQLGVPYRRNTSKPGIGFDCSGLTGYAWAMAGTSLPRNSRSQINSSAKRTRDTAQAGDLMYYPGHIMMWLGVDDAILHSPYTGRTVELSYLKGGRHNSVRFGDPTG